MNQQVDNLLYKNHQDILLDLDYGIECDKGWDKLLNSMLTEMKEVSKDNKLQFEISQIKEKYGKLRCYTVSYSPEINTIIEKYEALSARICEQCGNPGTIQELPGKWLKTLCEDCYGQRQNASDTQQDD